MAETADPSDRAGRGSALDPAAWVDAHGDALYRYALRRVHDPATAEDLVQDTFLAALRQEARFAGRSSERTWMVGILKHKIVDRLRRECREMPVEDIESRTDPAEALFDERGRWRSGVKPWSADPRRELERKEFREVLSACLSGLPAAWRRVFVLREMEDESTETICKETGLSATNLFVTMHRARLRLRHCLSVNWFDRPAEKR